MYAEIGDGGERSQLRRSMDPIEEFSSSGDSPILRRRHRLSSILACFSRSPSSSSYSSSSTWWQKIRSVSMWSRGVGAFKRIREWSEEMVTGPRWKTLMRRLKRPRKKQASIVQYDPMSYALNFDEGDVGRNLDAGDGADEREGWGRNFSSRYANSKGPLDLSGGPTFV